MLMGEKSTIFVLNLNQDSTLQPAAIKRPQQTALGTNDDVDRIKKRASSLKLIR